MAGETSVAPAGVLATHSKAKDTRVVGWWSIIKRTLSEFQSDNCLRMAAAISYYSAFSLAPLLVLVVMLCGFVWDPADVRGRLQEEIARVVGPEGTAQIETMLARTDSPSARGTSVFSIAALLFGALGVVSQLQSSLNEAWGVQPDPSQGGIRNFLTKRLISAAMILTIALLLLVSLAVSAVISLAGDTLGQWLPGDVSGIVLAVASSAGSLVITALLFAAIYRILPDAEISWKDVWFGALVTALLFVGGKYFFGLYLASSHATAAYGAAGSLALLLLWLYYSAGVLLLGAEFTQVWSQRHGARVAPEPGAAHTKV
ncbi:MAG: YihY/virulence factor BrkB family protein [Planctomycetales bacterium]|nr:YihY/virulence factor BrkB family protein [Planctomycetales bacterium]